MGYGLWFMVYGLWFMVYGLWFTIYIIGLAQEQVQEQSIEPSVLSNSVHE